MRGRREVPNEFPGSLNLDSLVDIVSNSVGILVILAVFTALFSLLKPVSETSRTGRSGSQEEAPEIVEKLRIPWSHTSQKNSLLLLLRDDRVLYLDRVEVYRNLKKRLSGRDPLPSRLHFENYAVELTAGNGHAHCLEFFPLPGAGKWWHQFIRREGVLSRLLKKYFPEETYFFFWVAPNSFDLFRELRKSLWEQRFEVGWKPVRADSPLRYCSGDSQTRSFQPQ